MFTGLLRFRSLRTSISILVCAVGIVTAFAATEGRGNVHPASATSGRAMSNIHTSGISPTNYPVVFIHGVNLTRALTPTNCKESWDKSIAFLQGTGSTRTTHFTGQMDMVGYYDNDKNCSESLTALGSSWRTSCYGVDSNDNATTPDPTVGTVDESIRHLSCEFAWYIYDTYSQYDTNADIVAYSMGGLIARYALYGVQSHLASFPPVLYARDAVDFDTPNGGFPGPLTTPLGCQCLQALQMITISDFMSELRDHAQNPQGAGQGTTWTLLGSIPASLDPLCDRVVDPTSSMYMDSTYKVVYVNPCYGHVFFSMMEDKATQVDATVYDCNNCTKDAALGDGYLIWNVSFSYPHAIHEMFDSLVHRLSSTAIVSVSRGARDSRDACTQNSLGPSDDGSTSAIALPFTANFFGLTYNSVYVNNNGNVSFDTPLFDYTPYPLAYTTHVMIAPFFADVDTRVAGSGMTTYGKGLYQGHATFCVDWLRVGYYGAHTDKLNSFQLLLIDRSDRAPGDFDIEMNYNQVQWETGDASSGTDGFGGVPARVGYTNGSTASFELTGSGISGALLDINNGLVAGNQDSSQPGSYIFPVQNTGTAMPGKISTPETRPAKSQPKH